jgi:hypothetical protein
MSEIKLRKVMRCPVCFARENDVTLAKNGDEYYCVHCSYHGTAEETAGMYLDLRKKYRWIQKRVTLDELRTL